MLSSLSLSFGRLMIASSICRVTAIYGEPNERITNTTDTRSENNATYFRFSVGKVYHVHSHNGG